MSSTKSPFVFSIKSSMSLSSDSTFEAALWGWYWENGCPCRYWCWGGGAAYWLCWGWGDWVCCIVVSDLWGFLDDTLTICGCPFIWGYPCCVGKGYLGTLCGGVDVSCHCIALTLGGRCWKRDCCRCSASIARVRAWISAFSIFLVISMGKTGLVSTDPGTGLLQVFSISSNFLLVFRSTAL